MPLTEQTRSRLGSPSALPARRPFLIILSTDPTAVSLTLPQAQFHLLQGVSHCWAQSHLFSHRAPSLRPQKADVRASCSLLVCSAWNRAWLRRCSAVKKWTCPWLELFVTCSQGSARAECGTWCRILRVAALHSKVCQEQSPATTPTGTTDQQLHKIQKQKAGQGPRRLPPPTLSLGTVVPLFFATCCGTLSGQGQGSQCEETEVLRVEN